MNKRISTVSPIIIVPYPNGGYVIEQEGVFQVPASAGRMPNKCGAYSTAEDLIAALSEALIPPPTVDYDPLNDGWLPMSTAPRDRYVSIRDDTGYVFAAMHLVEPYWWETQDGSRRVGDPETWFGSGSTLPIMAAHWRECSPTKPTAQR